MGNFIKPFTVIFIFIMSSNLHLALAADYGGIKDGAAHYYKKDYVSAFRRWAQLAQNDNIRAQHNIGVLYFKGLGVKENKRIAIGWFKRAAKNGFVLSQHNLGWAYEMGLGVKADLKKANYWYELAAKQNFGLSEDRIGFLLYKNELYKEALGYLRRAASRGEARAQFLLGEIYAKGLGVRKNIKTALRWYKAATNHGNSKAAYALGRYYIKNYDPKFKWQIVNLLSQAAEKNNVEAIHSLGWIHAKGIGVSHDNKKAIEIFKKSAVAGYAESAINIAALYSREGKIEEVYYWLLIAESLGANDISTQKEKFKKRLDEDELIEIQEAAENWLAGVVKYKGSN